MGWEREDWGVHGLFRVRHGDLRIFGVPSIVPFLFSVLASTLLLCWIVMRTLVRTSWLYVHL